MRLLLLMLGIGVCVVGIGTRAEAQNYPRFTARERLAAARIAVS
jgi:hypothetical protein